MKRTTDQAASSEAAPPGRRRARPAWLDGPAGAYVGVSTILVAMVAYLAMTQSTFLTYDNLINILQTNSVLLVVSIGLTIVLLVGGFDLSIGAMLALSGVLLAELLLKTGLPAGVAIALIVLAGLLMGGIVNGIPIAWLGLSFFVVTIGTMSIFRGLALVITQGQAQGLYEQPTIRELGTGTIASVPYSVVIALAIFGLFVLVLRYTGYGRMIYAVGGNAEAARLAGIRVSLVRMSAYALAGGLGAVAGVLQSSRLATAEPTAATGIELTAAAAVLLGGTSFAGGSGTLLGTLLGTLFLGTLSNGLTLSGVSSFWQNVVTGVVLLLAVGVDRYRKRSSE